MKADLNCVVELKSGMFPYGLSLGELKPIALILLINIVVKVLRLESSMLACSLLNFIPEAFGPDEVFNRHSKKENDKCFGQSL